MCQPKPGPRCAAHVRAAIAKLDQQAAENLEAFMAGRAEPHKMPYGRRMQLQDEYDETSTGQAELAGKLNALENNEDPDTAEIDRLHARMLQASDRRAAKVAALKSKEAGDAKAAAAQVKYGAHAGWLGHSRILDETKDAEHGDPVVFRDYAVGFLYVDRHDETAGYEEAGRDFTVIDHTLIYEAPATPGPRPGTWVVGANVGRHNQRAALLAHVPDFGTNRSHHTVEPVVYDTTNNTVARFDTRTGLPVGTPADIDSARAIELLDYNAGWDTLYSEYEEHLTLDRVTSEVTVDQSGATPVLRVNFDTSQSWGPDR